MKRRTPVPGTNGNGNGKAKKPKAKADAPAAPRIPNALVPMNILQGITDYLKKRPYDEVAHVLMLIATECRNENGTPLNVTATNAQGVPHA